MIVYFSKINLDSVELLQMYKSKELLLEMKKTVASFLKSGIVHEVEQIYKDENGETHLVKTKYRISIGTKTDEYISGVLYKTTHIYYKTLDELTGKTESHIQPTVEDVRFYYDISREIIGFHTRNRFGYQEFNEAFQGILNSCMIENGLDYRFSLSLCTEGLAIEEIKKKLKKIKNIKKLEFLYKLPNPADDYMLENLNDELTDMVGELKDSNANTMNVVFDSNGNVKGTGLNLDSQEIQKNFDRVARFTKGISSNMATKNGYIRIQATGKDGKKYTTDEEKPIKREINDDSEDNFFLACRDTILGFIFRN